MKEIKHLSVPSVAFSLPSLISQQPKLSYRFSYFPRVSCEGFLRKKSSRLYTSSHSPHLLIYIFTPSHLLIYIFHTLIFANLHLHTFTPADLHLHHLHTCWSTSSHSHICLIYIFTPLTPADLHLHTLTTCWSTSSHPSHLQIYIFTPSHLQNLDLHTPHICWSTSFTPSHLQIYIFTPSHLQILHLHTLTSADLLSLFFSISLLRRGAVPPEAPRKTLTLFARKMDVGTSKNWGKNCDLT